MILEILQGIGTDAEKFYVLANNTIFGPYNSIDKAYKQYYRIKKAIKLYDRIHTS